MNKINSASRLLLFGGSLAVLAACASRPPPFPEVARDDFVAVQRYASQLSEAAVNKKSVQGLSIAIVDDQRIVWAGGFGFADVGSNAAATPETLYRVGSLSKLLTTAAAMQLVESGKIELDAPVDAVLGGFAPRSWDGSPTSISARMLMSHHSGLPRDVYKGFQAERPVRFTDEAGNFKGYTTYKPGQIYSYSNLGFSVLGSMIERVGGVKFEDYMQASLLAPLQMVHSTFSSAVTHEGVATGYRGSNVVPFVPVRDVPAGGLNSNVRDLSRLLMMVFAEGRVGSERVLAPGSVAEMLSPQFTDSSLDFDGRIGLGWFLQEAATARITGGGRVASHEGAIDAHRSAVIVLPKHKLGVVVLTNSAEGGGVIYSIAARVLQAALQAKTGIAKPEAKAISDPSSQLSGRALPPEQMPAWLGTYTTRMGSVRIYTDDNKSLRVDAMGSTAELLERNDGRLEVKFKLLGLIPFPLAPAGEVSFSRRTVEGHEVLVLHQFGREALFGERVPSGSADANQQEFVKNYGGTYTVVDTGHDKVEFNGVRVFEERGVLFAELKVVEGSRSVRMVVRALNGSQALLLGLLADRGEMVQGAVKDGRVELEAAGLRFRRISSPGK